MVAVKDIAVGAVQILYVTVIPAGSFADEALDPGEFSPGATVKFVDDRVTKTRQGKRQEPSSQSRPG